MKAKRSKENKKMEKENIGALENNKERRRIREEKEVNLNIRRRVGGSRKTKEGIKIERVEGIGRRRNKEVKIKQRRGVKKNTYDERNLWRRKAKMKTKEKKKKKKKTLKENEIRTFEKREIREERE